MFGCGAGNDGGCEWECAAVDSADGGVGRLKSEKEEEEEEESEVEVDEQA
jgi:hypothetical protein